MSVIKDLDQFMQEIKCCRELKIERYSNIYTHHVFVGEIENNGCYLYHYDSVSSSLESSGEIKRVYLDYGEYKKGTSPVKDIFDLKIIEDGRDQESGNLIQIVKRGDYPKDEKAEKECIERAKERLGEKNYSARFNNCESYVNWIFAGDNTSAQVETDKTKKVLANMVDGASSRGVQRQVSQVPDTANKAYKACGGKDIDKMESMSEKIVDAIQKPAVSIDSLKRMTQFPNDFKTILNSDILKLKLSPQMREELCKIPSNVFDVIKQDPKQKVILEHFQFQTEKHLRTVAEQAKTGGIKQATNQSLLGAVGLPVVVEMVSLLIKLNKINNSSYMTEEKKSRQRLQECCSSGFGVTGMVIGQCCVPVVGGYCGGIIGNIVGGIIGGMI